MNLTRKSISRDTDRGEKDLSYGFWHIIGRLVKRVLRITPHGTPQCYGVFARRNHTLLDSVWSIISLIKIIVII